MNGVPSLPHSSNGGAPGNGDAAQRAWKAEAAGALAVALILLATLPPAPLGPTETPFFCLACGEEALADALRNVALFLPLGLAAAWWGAPPALALGGALLLTGSVELLQHWIPGRDPALRDLLANGVGAAAGYLTVRVRPRLRRTMTSEGAPLVPLLAGTGLMVLLGAGWLLTPSLPDSRAYAKWTPALDGTVPFEGRVVEAHLDSVALNPGPFPDGATADHLVEGRAVLRVTVEAEESRPAGPSPLFGIFDEERRELFLTGVRDRRLFLRLHTHGASLGLDRPEHTARLPAGFATSAVRGRMSVWKDADGLCVAYFVTRRCGMAFHLGDGWRSVYEPGGLPFSLALLLDFVWIAALTLPLGLGAGTHGAARRAVLVVFLLALAPLAPPLSGLAATPVHVLLAGATGVVLGRLARIGLEPAPSAAPARIRWSVIEEERARPSPARRRARPDSGRSDRSSSGRLFAPSPTDPRSVGP